MCISEISLQLMNLITVSIMLLTKIKIETASEIIDCDHPFIISSVNNILTDHKANTESIRQLGHSVWK